MSTPALARRDWFVDAAARRFLAAGAPVPTEALQRQAAADLRHLDAARASGALRVTTAPRKVAPKVADPGQAEAAKVGGRLKVRSLPATDRLTAPPPLTGVDAVRDLAMKRRLKLIAQKAGACKNGKDIGSGFEFRTLAEAVISTIVNHDARRGVYAGKSNADRDRILRNALERICDKSNAVIRPGWWVK